MHLKQKHLCLSESYGQNKTGQPHRQKEKGMTLYELKEENHKLKNANKTLARKNHKLKNANKTLARKNTDLGHTIDLLYRTQTTQEELIEDLRAIIRRKDEERKILLDDLFKLIGENRNLNDALERDIYEKEYANEHSKNVGTGENIPGRELDYYPHVCSSDWSCWDCDPCYNGHD